MPFACCVCPVNEAQNKMCVVVILTNFRDEQSGFPCHLKQLSDFFG